MGAIPGVFASYEPIPGSLNGFVGVSRVSQEDIAKNLARKRIYHQKEFDQEINGVNSFARTHSRGKPPMSVFSNLIVSQYNNAFKSKTYQDAMKNYELRQQFPDRYVPAGFESLQNLDMYAERGGALQRRGILGRRRIQSFGGEQVSQEAGL